MTGKARRVDIDDVLERTGPAPAAPAVPPAVATGRKPSPIRSTLDLPPIEHERLLMFAVTAQTAIGRPVKGQNVLRALVRRLIAEDPDGRALRAAIIEDLMQGKGQP